MTIHVRSSITRKFQASIISKFYTNALSTNKFTVVMNSNTPARVVPYLSLHFSFLAVLYLRYLSAGISSRAIDGKPIIFAKVSPPGNYGR